jgi:hypothetical protein
MPVKVLDVVALVPGSILLLQCRQFELELHPQNLVGRQ